MNAVQIDPDITLMLRVKNDEDGAFADLVAAFRSRIFTRLVRCLGDRQLAEDLTQDVFLRVFRGRKRYEPRARLTTWLYHIVHNVARNAIRAKQRHRWLCYAPLDRTEALHPDRFWVIDDRGGLERLETIRRVRLGIRSLQSRQRQALELQHYQGYSYPEIGRLLSLSAKAAKSLLYRARIELRKSLADFGSEA